MLHIEEKVFMSFRKPINPGSSSDNSSSSKPSFRSGKREERKTYMEYFSLLTWDNLSFQKFFGSERIELNVIFDTVDRHSSLTERGGERGWEALNLL